MPTDLGMSSTLNSDYMPYMKEPSLHLSDEPKKFDAFSYPCGCT